MLANPSLHQQVLEIAKAADSGLFVACCLASDPNTLVSLIRVDPSQELSQIRALLPYNLVPKTVLFLGNELEGQAIQLSTKLFQEQPIKFTLKGEQYSRGSSELSNFVAAADNFTETFLLGLSFEGTPQQMSRRVITK